MLITERLQHNSLSFFYNWGDVLSTPFYRFCYISNVKKLLLLLLYIPLVSFGQDKLQPGNTDFNSLDRIAINDLIDACGIYCNNNDLESYLSLYSNDAIGITY